MNDLASLNGKGTTLTVDGQEYRCLPLTHDDQGDLQAWIDSQQVDPFEVVEKQIKSGRFSIEVQKYLAESALRIATRNRVLLGSPEANQFLDTAAGERETLYLSMRKADPTITRQEVDRVYSRLREEAMDAARHKALAAADVLRGEDPDPKATPDGGPTSPRPEPESPSTGGRSTTRLRRRKGGHGRRSGR